MNSFGVTEHGNGVGAVGEGVGGHTGDRDTGRGALRSKLGIRCRRGPAADEIDVQRIGASPQAGDELVVGGFTQNIVETQGDRVIAGAGQDPVHISDGRSAQIDGDGG